MNSSAVMSDFVLLHVMQASTRFDHLFDPPRDLGIAWSRDV